MPFVCWAEMPRWYSLFVVPWVGVKCKVLRTNMWLAGTHNDLVEHNNGCVCAFTDGLAASAEDAYVTGTRWCVRRCWHCDG